jgi:hypothetical protein
VVVPDISPRASAVVFVRNPQRLVLADRTFFPFGCFAVPWERASGPTGLAPEALEKCVESFRVFSHSVVILRAVGSNRHWQYFSRPRRHHAHVLTPACVRCTSRRCSRTSSPRARAHSRRTGHALRLICMFLRCLSAGQGGEASTTPIVRVANRGFLIELLSGDSSGHPCPVR